MSSTPMPSEMSSEMPPPVSPPQVSPPQVSIVIPAYNTMRYLPTTLESVAHQTFQDYEVIIVDDGSQDGIRDWAARLDNPKIKVIFQDNAGSAAARNTGIRSAQGEYIAFLDGDDLWEPTKLAKQVRTLENDPQAGLVYSWIATIDASGRPLGKLCCNSEEGDVWNRLTEHDLTECGSNPMVRRTCFDQVGLFDPQFPYAQTWEMWLRIAAEFPFRVVEEPLVYYRFHDNNVSRKWQKMEASFTAIIEKVFAAAPPHRQAQKPRSYGFVYLCIAWKALQNMNGDCQMAQQFRQQALDYCPELRWSRQCVRLDIAIALVRLLGLDGYSQLRIQLHSWKKRLLNIPSRLASPSPARAKTLLP